MHSKARFGLKDTNHVFPFRDVKPKVHPHKKIMGLFENFAQMSPPPFSEPVTKKRCDFVNNNKK